MSKKSRRPLHEKYKASEYHVLRHIIEEQNQQIKDLRKLVAALRKGSR